MKHKKLLVSLDLDETLIYTEDKDYRVSGLERKDPDMFTEDDEPVFFRPGVRDFVKFLKDNEDIKIGVFTASQPHYANPILEELLGDLKELSHLFHQDRVTRTEKVIYEPYSYGPKHEVFKDLKKVLRATGADIKRTVAVDDKMLYKRQRGNVILVPDYHAEKEDTELEKVQDGISFLIDKENVRDFIKDFKVNKNIKKRYTPSSPAF
jgi:TFIIF-interacting CTD phosphatase-like protein